MKFLLVVAFIGLLGALSVSAGRSGEDYSDSTNSDESGRCRCSYPDRRGRGGTCVNAINGQIFGCRNTNLFRQCNGADCTVQACPTDQVWNFIKNACSACDAGKHISANLQVCACNQGTTFNSSSQSCVACPTNSTKEADRCYCPLGITVRDSNTNACRACPIDSYQRGDKCVCNNVNLFFNPTTWTCDTCPATFVLPSRRQNKPACRCTGLNQIFRKKTFSCYTCPTGTIISSENDECKCARYSEMEFDYTTGSCKCEPGFTQNAAGTCVRNVLNPWKLPTNVISIQKHTSFFFEHK